jgi:hypothetical protein
VDDVLGNVAALLDGADCRLNAIVNCVGDD